MFENVFGADPRSIYVIGKRSTPNTPEKMLLLGSKWAIIKKLRFW